MVDQRRRESAAADYVQPINAPASNTREQIGGECLCPVQRLIKKEPREERSLFKAIERSFASSPGISTFAAAGPTPVPLHGEAETIASPVVEPVNTPNLHGGTDDGNLFSKAFTPESQVQCVYMSAFSNFIG